MNHKIQIASMFIAWRYAKAKTQTQVAKALGVTFQQVQKYESSLNGLSAEKLLIFCNHYGINLNSFQDGDYFQVLDSAEIHSHYKQVALDKIEKLERIKNDKGRSEESLARESISQGTYL